MPVPLSAARPIAAAMAPHHGTHASHHSAENQQPRPLGPLTGGEAMGALAGAPPPPSSAPHPQAQAGPLGPLAADGGYPAAARRLSFGDDPHADPPPQKQAGGGGGEKDSTIDQRKYKTKLCRTWSSGNQCPYGDRCVFAHGGDDMRKVHDYNPYEEVFGPQQHGNRRRSGQKQQSKTVIRMPTSAMPPPPSLAGGVVSAALDYGAEYGVGPLPPPPFAAPAPPLPGAVPPAALLQHPPAGMRWGYEEEELGHSPTGDSGGMRRSASDALSQPQLAQSSPHTTTIIRISHSADGAARAGGGQAAMPLPPLPPQRDSSPNANTIPPPPPPPQSMPSVPSPALCGGAVPPTGGEMAATPLSLPQAAPLMCAAGTPQLSAQPPPAAMFGAVDDAGGVACGAAMCPPQSPGAGFDDIASPQAPPLLTPSQSYSVPPSLAATPLRGLPPPGQPHTPHHYQTPAEDGLYAPPPPPPPSSPQDGNEPVPGELDEAMAPLPPSAAVGEMTPPTAPVEPPTTPVLPRPAGDEYPATPATPSTTYRYDPYADPADAGDGFVRVVECERGGSPQSASHSPGSPPPAAAGARPPLCGQWASEQGQTDSAYADCAASNGATITPSP